MAEGLRQFLISASQGGGRNFRPIAAHAAPGGRRVRAGVLYRSGFVRELPDEVRARLATVRTVVTLQTPKEIEMLGLSIEAVLPGVAWEHVPIGDRWFRSSSIMADELESMGEFYVKMVLDHPEHWVRFFTLVADADRAPLLFHCTAGRDRTGVAAALLLDALGVERATILADYLVSNEAFPDFPQAADVLEPLFATIDAAGGIDAFLTSLGVPARELVRVREHLLEDSLEPNG